MEEDQRSVWSFAQMMAARSEGLPGHAIRERPVLHGILCADLPVDRV